MADGRGVLKAGSRVRLGLASDEWLVACVRRGDTAAFEALYDRHVRELLGFCVYMLGSRQDGEDAVQATFASAYRALRADGRAVSLRPWLFTIARNECLTILRRRRPVAELGTELAPGADPVDQIELRDEVRRVFEGLAELPESQRAALVLAEVHGLSHQEVGEAMGVRADQVKAFVYQARSKLISERAARDTDCREIREELAGARGSALLRGRLRRHVRACPECRSYADGVARQRRQLGGLLPIVPPLALKARAIEQALNLGAADPVTVAGGATVGATAAGTAAELAGSGINALACKVAVGVACLGASAGVGVSVLSSPLPSSSSSAHSATLGGAGSTPLVASVGSADSLSWARTAPAFAPGGEAGGGGGHNLEAGSPNQGGLPVVQNGVSIHEGASAGPSPGSGAHGRALGGGHGAGSGSSGGGSGGRSGERSVDLERRVEAEQRRILREGRTQRREENRVQHEQPKTPRPPKSEEELLRRHEENAHRREEQGPEGHSHAPRTPQELLEKREKREKARAEKQKLLEEQEAREAGEAAPPAP